jgi:hypothetical protein
VATQGAPIIEVVPPCIISNFVHKLELRFILVWEIQIKEKE